MSGGPSICFYNNSPPHKTKDVPFLIIIKGESALFCTERMSGVLQTSNVVTPVYFSDRSHGSATTMTRLRLEQLT